MDETAWAMTVAMATPSTFILNLMTNTKSSTILITADNTKKYKGVLESPTDRSKAEQALKRKTNISPPKIISK